MTSDNLMELCPNCGAENEGNFKFCPACGAQMVGTPDDRASLLGKTLNSKYRIISEIGSGSMGTVYLAEHTGLQKRVAIKVLRSDLQLSEETIRRFQREGIAAGRFNHQGAIQVFDFDRTEDKTFYLAMEYIEGNTLSDLITRTQGLTPDRAVGIILQVLSVLEAAHKEGIVHRDLKPENIMTVGDDEDAIKVLDFGLSKLVDLPADDSVRTQMGQIIGSPRYMAPEQCKGEGVDHRIDIYATGLILFEMLAGDPPAQGESVAEILVNRTSEPAPRFSEQLPELAVPADLEAVLEKALKRDPAERYQSAEQMAKALLAISYSKMTESRPSARDSSGEPGSRIGLPAILAVVVLAACAIWYFVGDSGMGADGKPTLVSMIPAESRTADQLQYVTRLNEAREKLRARTLDVALLVADEAVAMACVDAEAYEVRGWIYKKQDDLDMARADFEEALRLREGYAAAQAGLGWILVAEDDLTRALTSFDSALADDPDCLEAMVGKSAVHFRFSEYTQVKDLAGKALVTDPGHALANYYLGSALLGEGDLEGAIKALVQAKRADDRSSDIFLRLGEAYHLNDEHEQAERHFRGALALDPGAKEAGTLLGALLIERERYSEARTLLSETLLRHGDEARLHVLNGVAQEAEDLLEQAAQSLEQGLELTPLNQGPKLLLGILLLRLDRPEEALGIFESMTVVDDSRALPFLNQGMALFMLGEYAAGAEAMQEALRIEPDDPFTHRGLNVLYRNHLDQAEQARVHEERVAALGGFNGQSEATPLEWLEGDEAGPDALYFRVVKSAVERSQANLKNTTDLWDDHSQWENAWEVQSGPYRVRTTHSRYLAKYMGDRLCFMLEDFKAILNPEFEADRPFLIYLFPGLEQYNTFGNDFAADHSSIYGSFLAIQNDDRPVAVLYNDNDTLLTMYATHSALHQFLDRNYTNPPPTWIDEGLASYFAYCWAYTWGVSQLQTLIDNNRFIPLSDLIQTPIQEYGGSTEARFLELGMFFYYLLTFREDTMMTRDDPGAFAAYLRAVLAGNNHTSLPFHNLVTRNLNQLEEDFKAFVFPTE